MRGASGSDVKALADALAHELGADAATYPVLEKARPTIDAEFDAAIRRWQAGVSIIADGVVGPYCQRLLGLVKAPPVFMPPNNVVFKLFPATKAANVSRYLAYIEAALATYKLTDRPMVLCALGTIRAETEGFVPINEGMSRFNTAPGGAPFALYDGKLGNRKGEGAMFRGRGFVQLTGRNNYAKYGEKIGIDLTAQPELANTPEVAALLLAAFLDDAADRCRTALAANDLAAARKLVNGGAHGLDRFTNVFDLAAGVWPVAVGGARAKKAAATAGSATTSKRSTGTRKDPFDARDRFYMPLPQSLPPEHPTRAQIADLLPRYSEAGLILDQGDEGACTGFGLACVVNYLRWVGHGCPKRLESVSPRMLYVLARRYDEYQGEDYEGSSCRGALKGWYRNGVCLHKDWPDGDGAARAARYGFARRAAEIPLGIYYRVEPSCITDMQAAIAQHGAIYVSSWTHDGWDHVPSKAAKIKGHADLPRIPWDGKPARTEGHAYALVGFNRDGFVIQNSWGKDFGAGGFAVLAYADWLTHGMDAWVVALGVPGVVAGSLTAAQATRGKAAGASHAGWWDKSLAYQHSVVLGNDGRVSRYLTEDEAPRKLQHQCFALPDAWFRTRPTNERKRVVLYVHGGLNSESDAIDRAAAMGRYFAGNGCYPIFIVWKTGLLESLQQILQDRRQQAGMVGGVAEWVTDKTDLLIEKTIGRPLAKPIWSEMKGNAELAFAPRHGGELLLDALETLQATWGDQFELHLAGHSAGSIWLGYLLNQLAQRGKLAPTGIELLAPACSVAFANTSYANSPERMQRLRLHVLGNQAELDDTVAVIYRKSLLYLVSNALETDLRTPLLGLHLIEDQHYDKWDGSSDTREALSNWRRAAIDAELDQRTHIVGGLVTVARPSGAAPVTAKASHGNIDNDVDAISQLIQRVTGQTQLAVPVDDLRGA